MRIVYIGAGAGGMFCGSCLRDNALAAALVEQKREIVLVPAYTPMRVDEPNVSGDRVVYGALNMYMQHASPFFRRAPRFLNRWLDSPALIKFASRFSGSTRPESLGELTLSILAGDDGPTRRELVKMAEYLATEFKPEIINLPNAMFAGMARELKRRTGAPVVCTVSGEDSFIAGLPEPYKAQSQALMREKARDCDGFLATTHYYADFMCEFLAVPADRMHIVPLGISTKDYPKPATRVREPFTISHLARLHPDKGLDTLAEAFVLLRQTAEGKDARLRIAGYMDARDAPHLEKVKGIVARAGLADSVEFRGEVDRARKIGFLRMASVLSVPSAYPEPKGLPVLEAFASGLPVVQPRSGSFPELVEPANAGILVEPGNAAALAEGLRQIAADPAAADAMGRRGREWVENHRTSAHMAEAAYAVYERYV